MDGLRSVECQKEGRRVEAITHDRRLIWGRLLVWGPKHLETIGFQSVESKLQSVKF